MSNEFSFDIPPITLESIAAQNAPDSLDLNAPPQAAIPSITDQPEQGNKFRDFVLRAGGGRPSLLNTLSAAFGRGTEEIAATNRAQKLADLDVRFKEAQIGKLNFRPEAKRSIIKDAAGFQRDAGTGERIFPDVVAPPKGNTALNQKIKLLEESGVDRETAIGIATGRLVASRDPITGVATVVDKAATQRVRDTPPQIQPEPKVKTLDVDKALGVSGAAKAAVNTIVDLFGGNLPFEKNATAAAELSNLNNETIQLLRAGIGGRPNVQLQKRVEKLLVEPNAIFQGEQGARSKFKAIFDTINTEKSRLENDLKTQSFKPATVDKARQKISELTGLAAKYKAIIDSQKPKEKIDLERFFN